MNAHPKPATRTTVINVFGGPGIGKSTTAALIFQCLKEKGKSVEMSPEFIKKWVWNGIQPKFLDYHYIFANQSKSEYDLFGKVEYIVTDSPVLLSVYYAHPEKMVGDSVSKMYEAYKRMCEEEKVSTINIMLKRLDSSQTNAFDEDGRFHNEEQSKQIDKDLIELLNDQNVQYDIISPSKKIVENYVDQFI